MNKTEKLNSLKKIQHIGIIMDGNRRYSKKLMLDPWKGHLYGAKKVRQVLEWCKDLNIAIITLYAFSYENFNRPKQEFDFLMKIFENEFDILLKDPKELMDDGVKISFVGRIEMFPKRIQDLMHQLIELTKNNSNFFVNFAMAYSGRIEIVDAIKKIINSKIDPSKIDEKVVLDNLYLSSEPDIIIRTGGDKRLSNFLLFQSAYSELFFVDALFPEITKEQFDKIVIEYNNRERRFGK